MQGRAPAPLTPTIKGLTSRAHLGCVQPPGKYTLLVETSSRFGSPQAVERPKKGTPAPDTLYRNLLTKLWLAFPREGGTEP